MHVPGIKVVLASTAADARGLLWSSIYDDNPVVFFEHRSLYNLKDEVPDEIEGIELGKARVHREGEDVTVVATGRLVHEALAAAEEAAVRRDLGRGRGPAHACPRRGCDRRLRAQDEPLRRRSRGRRPHGLGAEIAAVVQYGAFDYLDAPIERVGARFTPVPFAPVMEEYVIPHAEDVLAAVKRTVARL